MQRTANLGLPFILPSQAQKHVTHNEALRALDAIVQLSVLDLDRASPPDEPQEGERHIVAAGASGVWAGKDEQIAAFQDGAWMFYSPLPGWLAWVEAQGELLAYEAGNGWIHAGGPAARLEQISIHHAAADSYNRLALNAPASLFNHDGAGHRLVINRNGAGDTASIVFQTGFSGRAEMGLAGDDAWRLKLSEDGLNWLEALSARASGELALGGPIRLCGVAVSALPDPAEAGPGSLIFVTDAADGAIPAFSDGAAWRRISDRAVIG